MKIIRWMSYPNHHQQALWDNVEELAKEKILYVFNTPITEIRKKQGWKGLNYSGHAHLYLDSLIHGKNIIDENMDAIHIFHSFMGLHYTYPLLIFYALLKNVKVVVTAEPFSIEPTSYFEKEIYPLQLIKQRGRKPMYQFIAKVIKTIFSNNPPLIMAISTIAERQFKSVGFSPRSIYSFGYFIPKLSNGVMSNLPLSQNVRICYVGSLSQRKGMDQLIIAMKKLNDEQVKVELSVYGTIQDRKYYEVLNLENVVYYGKIAPELIQTMIKEYDFLILPSIHDGWGVVVNEALLNGVPVIVSDRVGASCLIKGNNAGLVFNNDTDDLYGVLLFLVNNKDLQNALKINAINFPVESISPSNGANHLINSINHFFFQVGEKPCLFWGDSICN